MKAHRDPHSNHRSLSIWLDQLQASGRYTFTTMQAQSATGASASAVYQAARRLRRAGRVAPIRGGLYTLIPLEHRANGSPPASWFIDDLMRHLRQAHYVGLLTAASLHGASHQAVQVFQVVTDRPTRAVEVGRVRVGFVQSGRLEQTPVVRLNTATGTMAVSTPEATAFDLVRYRSASGGLNNVATVLSELAESIDSRELLVVAASVEVAVVQRTGFLLELVGAHQPADALAEWLSRVGSHPVALRPDLPIQHAPRNARWRVLVNDQVEPDL